MTSLHLWKHLVFHGLCVCILSVSRDWEWRHMPFPLCTWGQMRVWYFREGDAGSHGSMAFQRLLWLRLAGWPGTSRTPWPQRKRVRSFRGKRRHGGLEPPPGCAASFPGRLSTVLFTPLAGSRPRLQVLRAHSALGPGGRSSRLLLLFVFI